MSTVSRFSQAQAVGPACADPGVDPELFFPVSEYDTARIEQAKAVCAGCAVLTRCREWALASGDQGVLGGTTTEERAALRRRHRLVAVPDVAGGDDRPDFGEVAA